MKKVQERKEKVKRRKENHQNAERGKHAIYIDMMFLELEI
jgi:hypothetical protein